MIPSPSVNYDLLAADYDTRYTINRLPGVARALHQLAEDTRAGRILEVGCGTGRWLNELAGGARVVGLDRSWGMLGQARVGAAALPLVHGAAEALPFEADAFNLVFCVNAIHHFANPQRYVNEARRVLRPGGVLAVIGMDPHGGRDRWYLYDYFDGARDLDRARFPSCERISDWMSRAGLRVAGWAAVEHISGSIEGRDILHEYFLEKASTSQLALLTDEAYRAGRRKIETAVAEAERAGRRIVFETDLALVMVAGRL